MQLILFFVLQDNDTQPKAYTELLYAHLLDSFGTRLTYTHLSTKVDAQELIEVFFNRPVYVQKNKVIDFSISTRNVANC